MSQYQTLLRACPTSWRETSWHRYGVKRLATVTLCIAHVILTGRFQGLQSLFGARQYPLCMCMVLVECKAQG